MSANYHIEAFYVELLAADWAERRTREGQVLLAALREYVAAANDSTDEEAQNTCEELARRVRFEEDPHEPRDYNDADGVETMLDHG